VENGGGQVCRRAKKVKEKIVPKTREKENFRSKRQTENGDSVAKGQRALKKVLKREKNLIPTHRKKKGTRRVVQGGMGGRSKK